MTKDEFYRGKVVASVEWWLHEPDLPEHLAWARLRVFADGTADQARWDRDELPRYAERVEMARTPAFMVNYLTDDSLPGDHSFGGAFVISAKGEVLASLPLGEDGILIVEMETI